MLILFKSYSSCKSCLINEYLDKKSPLDIAVVGELGLVIIEQVDVDHEVGEKDHPADESDRCANDALGREGERREDV